MFVSARFAIARNTLLFDQFRELVEEVRRVMGTGRGFGMILHAEDRQFGVLHSFDGPVVEIHMGDLDI